MRVREEADSGDYCNKCIDERSTHTGNAATVNLKGSLRLDKRGAPGDVDWCWRVFLSRRRRCLVRFASVHRCNGDMVRVPFRCRFDDLQSLLWCDGRARDYAGVHFFCPLKSIRDRSRTKYGCFVACTEKGVSCTYCRLETQSLGFRSSSMVVTELS